MALTKHPEGSLRELCAIALPLMLTSLSAMTMIFADRLFLAHFSGEAHNAAVGATTLGWAFIFGWMILTSIAEVFVAQYNGAGMRSRLGEPVWQMIWVSLASSLFFLPLSIWGTGLIFGSDPVSELERQYFSIMVSFGPIYALYAALTGFFVGQGKTKLVTWVVVCANVCNISLDAVLIFGVDGLIDPLGITGAAIATSFSTLFEFVVLFYVFLLPKNRKECGTSCWQLKWEPLRDCVKVGFPTALFVMVEIFAYGIYYSLMKQMGQDYITVAGICQSMLILFFFFAEGINKSTATLVGNLIGAGRTEVVPKVIRSGLTLNLIFLVFILSIFSFGMPLIIDQFLPHADSMFVESIRDTLKICLIMTAIYVFFEGVRMQFAGVLTAAGDTFFLLVAGALSVWAMMLLPIYIVIVVYGAPVEYAMFICMVYSAIACLIYYRRILGGKWRSLSISADLRKLQQG
jgi:putative efflux protein, MATE family